METIIENNKASIIELCKKHYIKKLYVFGSAGSGNFNKNSDVDFLYEIDIDNFIGWANGEYDYTDNLLDFENALSQLLNRKIDLMPVLAISNRFFKATVDRTKNEIYAA